MKTREKVEALDVEIISRRANLELGKSQLKESYDSFRGAVAGEEEEAEPEEDTGPRFELRCPSPDCTHILRLKPDRAGKMAYCPLCGMRIQVPDREELGLGPKEIVVDDPAPGVTPQPPPPTARPAPAAPAPVPPTPPPSQRRGPKVIVCASCGRKTRTDTSICAYCGNVATAGADDDVTFTPIE